MRYPLFLGPFHPGWPGALRLGLEVENGIVQAAETIVLRPVGLRAEDWAGLSVEEGLLGIERLCASSSSAYTLAYCQALEMLAGLEVPPRARYARVVLAELERMADHLLAVNRICHLIGLTRPTTVLLNLREGIVRFRQQLTGCRFFSGLCVPGGLRRDLQGIEDCAPLIERIKASLYRLTQRLLSRRLVASKLVGVGLLTKERAEERGVGGPVARASESLQDLRLDQPYAAYSDLAPQVVTQGGGDVFARWMVLILEVFESLRLLEAVLGRIPAGPVCVDGPIPPGEAQSRVEAPNGPLVVRIQVAESGQLAGVWRSPPSPVHMAVLPGTLVGQQLEHVGTIVASWNLCTSCLVR